MDAVPYVFCSSVLAILQCPYVAASINARTWQRAAEECGRNLISCRLDVAYEDGVWWYRIVKSSEIDLSFEEFQKLERRHLRVDEIHLNFTAFNSIQSSIVEIKAIATYTLPLMNIARLFVNVPDICPRDDLLELLSLFNSSLFREIVYVENDKVVSALLRAHHVESEFVTPRKFERRKRRSLERYLRLHADEMLHALRQIMLRNFWNSNENLG